MRDFAEAYSQCLPLLCGWKEFFYYLNHNMFIIHVSSIFSVPLDFKLNMASVESSMKVKGEAFGNLPFRSKIISVGDVSLPLHNGLINYFYVSVLLRKYRSLFHFKNLFLLLRQVTSTGAIVFLTAQQFGRATVDLDTSLYDSQYAAKCPQGCSQFCNGRSFYECYTCQTLCQRVATLGSPKELAALTADPIFDVRSRSRTNLLPIQGVFFPMWTSNFFYGSEVRRFSFGVKLLDFLFSYI